ncbi:MAG TPA: hypothetical protein VFI14_07015 [Chryseosolibacter sp.]|nr:hypothetical protein [Chryseosolibacter sp.]
MVVVMADVKNIEVLQLRQLLLELREHRPDICFRYRLMGRMWTTNFLRVIKVTEDGVLLNDETSNKFVSLPDLSQVIQFEIDKSFQTYEPYFHYNVMASSVR